MLNEIQDAIIAVEVAKYGHVLEGLAATYDEDTCAKIASKMFVYQMPKE